MTWKTTSCIRDGARQTIVETDEGRRIDCGNEDDAARIVRAVNALDVLTVLPPAERLELADRLVLTPPGAVELNEAEILSIVSVLRAGREPRTFTIVHESVKTDAEPRIIVEGSKSFPGFSFRLVPPGDEGVKVQGGPKVPGPWAYGFPHAGVIDNHGGSRAERERLAAEGRLVHAKIGDRFSFTVEGQEVLVCELAWAKCGKHDDRHHVELVPVEA